MGQFGTRSQGGSDSASPRYIFTQLNPLTRLVFPAADDPQLDHVEEDGLKVEPQFYVPIIPMLLVNGSQGIGTGWSTSIPPHDVRAVLQHTRELVVGQNPKSLLSPQVKGFKGEIIRNADGNFFSHGVIQKLSRTTLEITELPLSKTR